MKGATGVPTTSTYAYTDTAHPAAVTSVAGGTTTDSFGYDAAGRMVSRTVNGVTTTLTWDVTSSLVESNGQGGRVVYAYDASGQRVAQARVADANGVGTATGYVASGQVDDANTAATSTGDVTATRYYTFAGSTVAIRTNDNKLALTLGDEQGSTNVMMPVTVQASGALASATLADAAAVTRTSYTPYGQLRGADNTATDRGWLGQVEDRVVGAPGTGLTYLNARYYDPATSRFISPDPLMNPGDPKTLDPYRYADNNPVVFTDASGLSPCSGLSAANEKTCLASYYKGTGYKAPTPGVHTVTPSKPATKKVVPATPPAKPSGGGILGSIKSGIGNVTSAVTGAVDGVKSNVQAGVATARDAVKGAWNTGANNLNTVAGWGSSAWGATKDAWNNDVVPWWKEHGDEVLLVAGIVAAGVCIAVSFGTCAIVTVAVAAATIVDGKKLRGWTNEQAATYGLVTVLSLGMAGGATSTMTYAGMSARSLAAAESTASRAGIEVMQVTKPQFILTGSMTNVPGAVMAGMHDD